MARGMLTNPVQLNIGNSNALVANESVTQYVEVVGNNRKMGRLVEVLKLIDEGAMGESAGGPEGRPKSIVFTRTKHACDRIANDLWKSGVNCDSLHARPAIQFRTQKADAVQSLSTQIEFGNVSLGKGMRQLFSWGCMGLHGSCMMRQLFS